MQSSTPIGASDGRTSPGSILVVQPYFTHSGHHGQAVLSMARVLNGMPGIKYLLLVTANNAVFDSMIAAVRACADVVCLSFPDKWPRLKAIYATLRSFALVWKNRKTECVVFLDSHLLAMAALFPLIPDQFLPRKVLVYYLGGPEQLCRYGVTERLIRKFLGRPPVKLVLRTDELAEAWDKAFHGRLSEKFVVMPHTESFVPDAPPARRASRPPCKRKLGVLGQIRKGKCLEWLVPAFTSSPDFGELHIAGSFANERSRREFSFLLEYPRFWEGFLEESRLYQLAGEMDYLVLLYDQWDSRMEAGSLFVAAKVNTPVIVFDVGWLGRMNREFGVGVSVPRECSARLACLGNLPAPGSSEYGRMIEGLARFRAAYSDLSFRAKFMELCV